MSYVQCSASKDVVRAAAQQAAKRLRDTSGKKWSQYIFTSNNELRVYVHQTRGDWGLTIDTKAIL